MIAKKIIVVCALSIIFILSGCAKTATVESNSPQRVEVIASFYPLAHFAEQVGGKYVTVRTIVPAGIEPHDFEPTLRDVEDIYSAQVLIGNGAGMEPWVERVRANAQAAGVQVLIMAQRIAPPRGDTEIDPHFWLDPVLAQQEIDLIRDAFVAADPTRKKQYDENAARYKRQLGSLDQEYKTALSKCKKPAPVLVAHDAFGYFSKRYGLTVIPIAGISPQQQPSLQRLKELAQVARTSGVTYIFFETLVSTSLAETLAKEIGAQTLVLNPLEGLTQEEIAAGADYFSVMRDNLQNLLKGINC